MAVNPRTAMLVAGAQVPFDWTAIGAPTDGTTWLVKTTVLTSSDPTNGGSVALRLVDEQGVARKFHVLGPVAAGAVAEDRDRGWVIPGGWQLHARVPEVGPPVLLLWVFGSVLQGEADV